MRIFGIHQKTKLNMTFVYKVLMISPMRKMSDSIQSLNIHERLFRTEKSTQNEQ